MSYPPNQGYPTQQGYGYPPAQGGYPPAQGGYPPAQGGYPPATNPSNIGFESLKPSSGQNYPQQPSYPTQAGYPPQAGYAPQPGYPPQPGHAPQSGYPTQSGYAPQPGHAPQVGHGHQPGHVPPPASYYPPQTQPLNSGYGASAVGYASNAQKAYPAAASNNSVYQVTKSISKMSVQTHGSIRPYPNFNAEDDAQVLRKAMKGIGTDEKAITGILSTRTNSQRQQIKTAFKQAYGKDLIKELKSELSGNYERLVIGLMRKPVEYDAYCLHKAMEGAGTDEAVLIEILASRSNAEIREINEVYKTLYKKNLEKELQSETSGHFRRLLVSLNNASRNENTSVDYNKARQDAENLYKAGEKKWGTDEAAFNVVMASRSHTQLRATFDEYKKIANRDIVKSLEGEFSGYILKGMLAIVGVSRDAPSYFASQFYKSMKGLGTSDDDLIRAAITRSEVDMEEIKQRFNVMYKSSLAKFISNDTSGDYKHLLLGIVGN